jgi:hypothetical protein
MDFQIGLVIGFDCRFHRGHHWRRRRFLMTPILLWFGIPTTAVGTDLLYAFTKMGGVYVHQKKIIIG